MTATPAPRAKDVMARAKALWDADRAQLRIECPWWQMPAWSRAHAWRRRPYIYAAIADECAMLAARKQP